MTTAATACLVLMACVPFTDGWLLERSSLVVPFTTMSDDTWLEPLDRPIEEVRRETEAIRKANAALKRLYDNNHEGMKRLADS
jgi:uncharacterized membrane protein